jgi:SAM-dependent methyltransferase
MEDSSMAAARVSGTEGYAEHAEALARQYESIAFEHVQRSFLHLIPAASSLVLDIGAGTGRDAAGFAALGHRVVAVEPTGALRERAISLHPSAAIDWLDDNLPALRRVLDRGWVFDLVSLSAVWFHLDPGQRREAMPNIGRLLRPAGVLLMSLRYGPVPPGRRMFAVSAEETIELAAAEGLRLVFRNEGADSALKRPGVSWTRLAFEKAPPAQ